MFVVVIVLTVFGLVMVKDKTNYLSFLNLNEKRIDNPDTANIAQKEKYGFYLNLSKDMSISEPIIDENGGKTILIQFLNLQTQIYTSPFDEDIVLTMAMIKQDIPDLKIKDEGEIEIDGIPGVKFIDLDQNTNEV